MRDRIPVRSLLFKLDKRRVIHRIRSLSFLPIDNARSVPTKDMTKALNFRVLRRDKLQKVFIDMNRRLFFYTTPI